MIEFFFWAIWKTFLAFSLWTLLFSSFVLLFTCHHALLKDNCLTSSFLIFLCKLLKPDFGLISKGGFIYTFFFPSSFTFQSSKFTSWSIYNRYRTKNLKRFIQGLVFKGILKGQESKSWDFFEGPRRFRGPQKSENFYFSKRTKTSVDHKFKSFAINWPQISI